MTAQSENEKHSAKNKLGLLPAISYIVSSIIGTGIFISPTAILQGTGSVGLSLIIWSACGLVALCGGLVYIEFGTSIRKSGKDYAYLTFVGWDPLAFAFVFTQCGLVATAACGIFMTTFGGYIMQAVLLFVRIEDPMVQVIKKILGLLMLYLLTAFNFYSLTKFAAKVQVATMFFKIIVLTAICCTGIYYIANGEATEVFANGMKDTKLSASGFVLALYGGFWAYSGWDTLNNGIEDMRNPKRDLPLAILIGTVLVIIIYLLTNIAYFAVLGPEGVLKSDAVVVEFAETAFGSVVAGIVPAIVGLMACATLNSALFITSRTMFVAARRRHFPSFLSCLSVDSESPRAALMLFAFMSTVMLFIGDLRVFIKYGGFVTWIQNVAAMCALFWIRFKKIPVHPGAIRMPIAIHFIFFAVAIFLVVLPAYKDPVLGAVGFGFVTVGISLFYLLVDNSKLPSGFRKANDLITVFAQKLFFAMTLVYNSEQLLLEKQNQRSVFPKITQKLSRCWSRQRIQQADLSNTPISSTAVSQPQRQANLGKTRFSSATGQFAEICQERENTVKRKY